MKRRTFAMTLTGTAIGSLWGNARASAPPSGSPAPGPYGGRAIDTHMHLRPSPARGEKGGPEVIERYLRLQEEQQIRYSINIGITGDRAFYEQSRILQPYSGRLGSLYALDWKQIRSDPDFFRKAPDLLEKAVEAGALGLKCFKDLGLTVRDREGRLLAIDDPRLFPIWERAEKLGTIVAFHTTDPVAFFAPWNPANERWKELELHPEWSFADRQRFPERDAILLQRDNVIRRYPGLRFHGCHVGNNSEDLAAAARRLDAFPNFSMDVAARLGELGRHSSEEGHRFFTKYQDRLMFGTDHMFYPDGEVQGAGPQKRFSAEENARFYGAHWTYFQTSRKQFDHPTPIQGDWKIDAVALEPPVLHKLYWENARRLYRLERYGLKTDR